MKVQVNVTTLAGEAVTLDLVAGADETAAALRARVAAAEPNPFPGQVLLLGGAALADDTKLSACGVKDGSALDFRAEVSEEALAKQFQELLHAKGPIGVEELGLLYSLQYGVTAGVALQALGKNILLKSFLEKFSKQFVFEGSLVKTFTPSTDQSTSQPGISKVLGKIPEDVAVQHLEISVSVRIELPAAICEEQAVDLRVQAADTVSSVKRRVADEVLVPFADRELLLAGKVLDDSCRLLDCGIQDASRLSLIVRGSEAELVAQLVALLQAKGPVSRVELDNMYCYRHGVSATQALQMLGWAEKLAGFLQRQPQFAVQGGCVALAPDAPPAQAPSSRSDNGRFLELDAKLRNDGFAERALQELERLADLLATETFLSIRRIELGGAAATKTAIPGAATAMIVLFVEGLATASRCDSWLPSLAQSVAGSLQEQLVGQAGVSKVSAAEGVVHIATDGLLQEVQVLFSPAFGAYSEAVQALKGQSSTLAARTIGAAASVTQKVRFVEKQTDGVKATMRLLKLWREQQAWSSPAARPSDDLLELAAAFSTTSHLPPRDLEAAVLNTLSLLSHFDELSVTWPLSMRSYREEDVNKYLLGQRPLVLDPANPFANHAAPGVFQPAELMAFAQRAVSGGGLFM
mmetsp:Transcript_130341/g.325126  ORF Transcript_130341/g.325126 Transcript_130341/m.325126 type:complete len:636 (-) Transcript_130341:313-2220(-)